MNVSELVFGIGAIPSGVAESRLGGKTLLLLYLFGSGLAAIIVALSNSLILLIFGLGFMGFFCSIYHPAGLTLISQRVQAITKGMAVHGIFGTTGSALGPIMATTLAFLISWRASYAVLGVFNIILALATLVVIPNIDHSGIGKIQQQQNPF